MGCGATCQARFRAQIRTVVVSCGFAGLRSSARDPRAAGGIRTSRSSTRTDNIIYIMRSHASASLGRFRRIRLAVAAALDRILLTYWLHRQGRAGSMSEIDPHKRTELTGPWAGFGFQGGHMFTPEGHSLMPCDMTWWSLTCNIAREWRTMMAEARSAMAIESSTNESNSSAGVGHRSKNVVHIRDVLSARHLTRTVPGVVGGGNSGPSSGQQGSGTICSYAEYKRGRSDEGKVTNVVPIKRPASARKRPG